MSNRNYRFRNGQALVEMALLLPVLLLLSVVAIDLGRGIYYYSVIYNAAREGARTGIVLQQPDNPIPINKDLIIQSVLDHSPGLDIPVGNITISIPTGTDTLKVTIKYSFTLITPLANVITGRQSFTLTSTSTMRIER